MARWEGFEPPTLWFVARYSIQLSYQRVEAANYGEEPLARQHLAGNFSRFFSRFCSLPESCPAQGNLAAESTPSMQEKELKKSTARPERKDPQSTVASPDTKLQSEDCKSVMRRR